MKTLTIKKLMRNALQAAALTAVTLGATETMAQTNELKSSPKELVDALHTAFGKHPNARAVHTKGIILEGSFTPAPTAASITKAAHFQKGTIPVTVRFSDFTGIPDISDTNGAANPRGFAIKFRMVDGTTTDIVGHSFNGFPTSNSDQFRELLLAIAASGPDAQKPTSLDQFLGSHPTAKTFLTTQKPAPRSYVTAAYYGVNAFKFTNSKGESKFVRYQFLPVDGEHYLTPEEIAKSGDDYLRKEIATRIPKHAAKYKMYAQVAEAGDKIEDPSIAWPDSRKLILLGTIEIKSVTPNTLEEDKKLSFIPNNLPAGIEPADPMINFRSRAYPISVAERNER